MPAANLDRFETCLARDLATAGDRYRARRVGLDVHDRYGRSAGNDASGEAVELSVDGRPSLYLHLVGSVEPLDEVRALLEQAQDEVMEASTEQWPACPGHRHALVPEPRGDWVAWCCPATDAALAEFGELRSLGS